MNNYETNVGQQESDENIDTVLYDFEEYSLSIQHTIGSIGIFIACTNTPRYQQLCPKNFDSQGNISNIKRLIESMKDCYKKIDSNVKKIRNAYNSITASNILSEIKSISHSMKCDVSLTFDIMDEYTEYLERAQEIMSKISRALGID